MVYSVPNAPRSSNYKYGQELYNSKPVWLFYWIWCERIKKIGRYKDFKEFSKTIVYNKYIAETNKRQVSSTQMQKVGKIIDAYVK